MKKIIIILTLVLASLIKMLAQNAFNNFVIETRSSKSFHFIDIRGEMNIKIVQDSTSKVIVKGSPFEIKNTITMLKNDTLFVYQTNTRKGDGKTDLIIHTDNIHQLHVSGKTNVDCMDLINAGNITVKVRDGAEVKLEKENAANKSRIEG